MIQKLCCISTDSCKFSCLGSSRNQNIKITYLLIIFIIYLISILKNISSSLSDQQIQEYHCQSIPSQHQLECIQQKKLTINFFSLSIFHLIILLFMLPKTKHIKIINQGLWIIKIILLSLIILIINLTLAPIISDGLSFIATLSSGLLYIIMNIIFVDFTYYLEMKINEKAQRNSKLHIIKIILSILLVISTIVTNIFSYWYNEFYVSISSSIMIGIFFILTFLRISKHNSLLVYGLNMLHISLITYSIHEQQNSQTQKQLNNIQHFYRIFFTILTLSCMISPGSNLLRTRKSTINQILALNTSQNQQNNRYVSSNKWLIYHSIMIIIVFLIPVVIKYETMVMEENEKGYLDLGRVIWWASAAVVYLWSILVQKVYPEQDLGELQNYFKEFQLN